MARYYPLNYATFGADIQAALEDFYGNGVTIHKVEALSITFSCPNICDKPIKIAARILHNAYEAKSIDCYVYPDDTLTSGVRIIEINEYLPGTFYGYHLVLSKRFLLAQTGYSDRSGAFSLLVAKASNGRCLVLSGAADSMTSNNARCLYTDKMTLTQIRLDMMSTGNVFVCGNQFLLKPVFFGEEYNLDVNEDGSLAYIDGLYSCGKYEAFQPQIGSNYYISVSGVRSNNGYGACAPGTFYVGLDNDGDGVAAIIPARGGSPSFISYIELKAANWVGTESPYSQVVTIPGVTENCKVEPDLSVNQIEAFRDKELAFSTENEDGVVTVYAIGHKPENDYTIQVTITEVDV